MPILEISSALGFLSSTRAWTSATFLGVIQRRGTLASAFMASRAIALPSDAPGTISTLPRGRLTDLLFATMANARVALKELCDRDHGYHAPVYTYTTYVGGETGHGQMFSASVYISYGVRWSGSSRWPSKREAQEDAAKNLLVSIAAESRTPPRADRPRDGLVPPAAYGTGCSTRTIRERVEDLVVAIDPGASIRWSTLD